MLEDVEIFFFSFHFLCKTATLKKTKNRSSRPKYHIMQVKSIAECSKGSILQYIQPSLSYHLSLRSLFCLFLSDRFTQVLRFTNQ